MMRPQVEYTNFNPGFATQENDGSNGATSRIGQWEVGEQVFTSRSWLGFAATHIRTGSTARMLRVLPESQIATIADAILESAERASRFSSKHVIRVLDWGLHESVPFVVTEPQGQTFARLYEGRSSVSEDE